MLEFSKEPKMLEATRTPAAAKDTEWAPISVLERTSLATANVFGKVVQKYAQAMVVLGSFHCLFHLADDLGFAQHHRIQARGYSEGVASGVVI